MATEPSISSAVIADKDHAGLVIRHFKWDELPAAVLDLRRRTFVQEKGFLTEESLVSANDRHGVHVAIYGDGGETLLGTTHVMLAEESDFSQHTGVPKEMLKHAVLSSRTCLDPDARYQTLFSLLIYTAMRWARMQGRTRYVGHIEDGMPAFRKMSGCEMYPNLPPRKITVADGHEYMVMPGGGDVNYAMHRTFRTLSKTLKEYCRAVLMPAELEAAVRDVIADFYTNPWFEAVWDETLTKRQYVAALANLHQYVRWTTRLLATMAGDTADSTLRNFFLEHLNGEVDHERMLERDLAHLGEDTDYVINFMSPQPDIFNYMSVQQSLAAFERDPILFMAPPLVAEGLSANMSNDFVKMLERRIASWGTAKPKHAMSFLASHIHTDGGEQGHWQAVIRKVAEHIQSEAMQQKFLTVVHAVIGSMNRAYADYMKAPDLAAFVAKGHDRAEGLPDAATDRSPAHSASSTAL